MPAMFTGIVERTLRITQTVDTGVLRRIVLPDVWKDVRPGESIAVNGVCLTVAELLGGQLHFDVVNETLRKTNLGYLRIGSAVNVERSLRVGDRLDGHLVQGHVDGVARLLRHHRSDDDWRMTIEIPHALTNYFVPKGSITLDGVSLTIASLRATEFEVALIPTTRTITTLGSLDEGWMINVECDVMTKTIVSVMERREGSTRSE